MARYTELELNSSLFSLFLSIEMADAIVSFAVQRIGDLLIQEAQFLYGVSDQVENIQTELNQMRCFLKDADSKASKGDERVRNCVAQIRDLAYDAEDIIESYALKVESRRRSEGIMNVLRRYACILNEGIPLYKVGSEIEAMTAKISNLTRSLQTYGIKDLIDGSSSSAPAHQRLPSYSHVAEPYFVGRDEGIEELVNHLVDNETSYRIVSICGMGGLGKSTLARRVYHHGEVRRRFDYFAWSCVSQQCKARDVWEGILLELTNEQRNKIEQLRNEELAKKLCEVLQAERCLVIIDDIWSIQAWDSLKDAFPCEETSSLILLTTRNKDVALHADPIGFHYEPRYLDEEESWELLQKIAIPQKNRADTRMEELGKEMLKHCGGLPLAITVLGGLLATKYSSNEWYTEHETIKSCLRRGKGHGQEQLGVFDVLALSYDDLPTELKPCFLYLSHFPEDYEIPVDKLIRLWVAEGIIRSDHLNREDGEEMVEDVAERYVNELIKRCMILVRERDANLRITTCHMHDLMRDLCLSKAKEENFLCIVDCQNGDEKVDIFPSSSSGKIRRLAIYQRQCRSDVLSEGLFKGTRKPHLRSLFCFSEFQLKHWSLEMSFFDNLDLLRILHLEGAVIDQKLAKYITKLIHLRYLSLMNACVSKLPSSLENLRCLQTLNLQIAHIVHIPNVLWKMIDLRHLYLPFRCDNKTKLRLGNLKNLQTLVNFSFKNFGIEELLNNMTNLRELSMADLYLIEDFEETFRSQGITLKHLRSLSLFFVGKIDVGSLVLSCINLYELRLDWPIEKLPDFHQLPASITDIWLNATKLEEDPMITLEKLPNLSTLTLSTGSFIGKQIVCSREGFPQLRSLSLRSLYYLEEWRVDEGAMLNLCHLEITNCEKLKTFPDGLRFVKTLMGLEINEMPKEFKDKLVEGGEDFHKVQNVPSVIFQDCEW